QQLGPGFSPGSDHLLALRAGLCDCVPFIPAPLILFRTHPDSISWTSLDLESYRVALEELWRRGVPIILQEKDPVRRQANLYRHYKWMGTDFISVANRRGGQLGELGRYLRTM